jgi:prophage regulatory protein
LGLSEYLNPRELAPVWGDEEKFNRVREMIGRLLEKAPMNRDRDLTPTPDRLLRLPEVLTKVPVGRASWWKGIKDGRYPAAIKLGPRTSAWRASDIDKLIASL